MVLGWGGLLSLIDGFCSNPMNDYVRSGLAVFLENVVIAALWHFLGFLAPRSDRGSSFWGGL